MTVRRHVRLGTIALVLVGATVLTHAQDGSERDAASTSGLRVEIASSKDSVTVGEPFTVDVTARGPAGTEWSFPAGLVEGDLELRAVTTEEPLPPGTQRYEAMAFALDEARLPPIEVRYRLADGSEGTLATEEVALNVTSLLPRDPDEQKLVDVRPPLGLDVGPAFWGTATTLLAALAALGYWLWRRRRGAAPAQVPPVPAIPPDVEARAALERLEERRLPAAGELRAFYIELVQIAKRYLERRLQAPVVEMTTTETCAFLREHEHGRDLLSPFRELAGAGDRVKFARGTAAVAEADGHLEQVRKMLDALEARLRPVPETGDEAAA